MNYIFQTFKPTHALVSFDPFKLDAQKLEKLSKEDLFSKFIDALQTRFHSDRDHPILSSILKEVLEYLESANSTSEIPIRELLSSKLDVVLAMLTHLDFGVHKQAIESHLLQIFEFLSYVPSIFTSRLIKLGIVDYVMDSLYTSEIQINKLDHSGILFILNMSENSGEFIQYLSHRHFLEFIFDNFPNFVDDPFCTSALLKLFLCICKKSAVYILIPSYTRLSKTAQIQNLHQPELY